MLCVRYNQVRLRVYEQLFEGMIRGEHCEMVAANLLVDTRWAEVSRGFVNCVTSNSCTNTLRPLAVDFGRLVSHAAELAFGTSRHSDMPSWFLQNNECFLASCLHKLILAYARQPALAPHQMRRAFGALFDVAEGLKSFLGLEYLARSTGAHALMSATANARCDFLKSAECGLSAPALCFAEMLADRILQQPGRELSPESSLCYFARSERWQQFAERCGHCFSSDEAFTRLQRQVVGQQHKELQSPGLFLLASTFLEADAEAKENVPVSPAPPRVAPTKVSKAPLVCRSAIRKRSQPFVKLVQRLLAGSKA